jgi:hypothetical protein
MHLLLLSDRHREAIHAFLEQHAVLHSASLVRGSRWSFQDEISADLTDEQLRQIPRGSLHSIAWLLWHIARTEDVTINVLLANTDQLLFADHWFEQLTISTRDIGTEMSITSAGRLWGRCVLGTAYQGQSALNSSNTPQLYAFERSRSRAPKAQTISISM